MKTNPHSLKLIQEAIRNDPNRFTVEPWAVLDMIEDLLEFHANNEKCINSPIDALKMVLEHVRQCCDCWRLTASDEEERIVDEILKKHGVDNV